MGALLSAGADVNATDGWGRTALHWAAARAFRTDNAIKADAVQVLLDAGADPNPADSHGVTPIDMAANPRIRELFPLEVQE